jgi:hypothetical protein
MQPLSRKEWLFPLLLALFFVLVGSLPYIAAHRLTPSGETFMGFVGRDTAGSNSYFAFARQAAEGRVFMTNLYTPHAPARAYLNPEWWLMGAMARWTGLSLEALFHIGRTLTVVAFLLAAYYLCAVVLPSPAHRRAALLLISCGSGLGWLLWLANRFCGTDLDLPWDIQGVSPFAYLMNKPHFMRAGIFAALHYAWFIRGDQTGRLRYFYAAGLAAAGHSLVRPYHIPESLVFLALYIFVRGHGGNYTRATTRALACGLGQTPIILWHAWILFNNSLGLQGFHAWYPALLLAQVFWYGLPFAAILVHLAFTALRGRAWQPDFSILALWIVSAMLLLQATPWFPWGVESYYPWILAPPILFLQHTWPACAAWMETRPQPDRARRIAVATIAALVLPSSLFAYGDFFEDLRHPDVRERYYVSHDFLKAADWLKDNAPNEPVVLASLDSSQFLPRLANLRIVSGQDALSANYTMMNDWVSRFYVSPGDDGFKQWLCRQQSVDFVLMGPFERAFAAMNPADHPWLAPVFESGDVAVYQVKLAP